MTLLESNPLRKRPRSVTILSWGVLIIAVWHLTRLFSALRQWDFLQEYPMVSPLYLVVSASIWAVISIPLGFGLWRGKRWAAVGLRIFVPLYLLYVWLDRLWIAKVIIPCHAWILPVAASLFILAFAFWALARKNSQNFFA
jgi:hypothetical protein